jgi:hypothetical protein
MRRVRAACRVIRPTGPAVVLGLSVYGSAALGKSREQYLSDLVVEGEFVHQQQWGKLGLDTAMVEGSSAPANVSRDRATSEFAMRGDMCSSRRW